MYGVRMDGLVLYGIFVLIVSIGNMFGCTDCVITASTAVSISDISWGTRERMLAKLENSMITSENISMDTTS